MRTASNPTSWFLVPYAVFVLASFTAVILVPKGDLHLALNTLHHPYLDEVFRLLTNLGDGWAAAAIALVVVVFFSYRAGIVIAAGSIVSGLIAQFLKHGPFADVVRPAVYFHGNNTLYTVPGVELFSYNSFPSGHAATACCVALGLTYVSRRDYQKTILALTGVLVAYSRVYLSQHFLSDVLAGSLIGVGTAWGCAALMYHPRTWNQSFDGSLMQSIRKNAM
jgi:membrane-associated phospholipid phosphatase